MKDPFFKHVAVMGAGAVGCFYGGMLARSGVRVTLIGRAAHVAALHANGLRLQTLQFDEQVQLAANESAAVLADADLVLVCVKSTDTETAATQMAPWLKPDALVLSLQNGVDNAPRLRALLPNAVQPAVVYVAAAMAGHGHVRHHGRGELVIGPFDRAPQVQALFAAAQVEVQVSDNVAEALWTKLVLNCAWNAVSAITRMPYGPLLEGTLGAQVQALLRQSVDECLAVAQAVGVVLPDNVWDQVLRIAHTMPTQTSSTAQDLSRGRPTEIAHLNGFIVREGARLGIPTPVNQALTTLVMCLQNH